MKPTNELRWKDKRGKLVLEQAWEEVILDPPDFVKQRPGYRKPRSWPKKEWRPVPVVE